MRRETRANLIFLTLFLGVTIPGAVVLFKKKLDPAAPPMFMPDFVRRRLPYMASQQSPAQVVRYVPELTGAWVSEMTRERAGGSRVLMVGRQEQPLVSDDHVIQVTAMQQQDAASTMLYLIVWDAAHTADTSRYSVTLASGPQRQPARVVSASAIAMPAAVKKELMNSGVIQPPNSVIWLTVEVPMALPSASPQLLELSFAPDQNVSRIHIPATGDFSTN